MNILFINIYIYILFFRPKRERKLPAHLKAGDFEYSSKALGLNTADSETKKIPKNSVVEPNQQHLSAVLEIPDEITDEIMGGESPKNVEEDGEDIGLGETQGSGENTFEIIHDFHKKFREFDFTEEILSYNL